MALDPKLKDAVNHLQSHAQGLRAVLDIADAIADIGTLEQLASEAESRKAAAYVAVDEVNDLVDAAKARLAQVNNDVAAAKENAARIIADAKVQASGLIAQAEADAAAAAQRVRDTADADLLAVNDRVTQARGTLGDLIAQTNFLRADNDALEATTKDLEERAQKARDFIASLKG